MGLVGLVGLVRTDRPHLPYQPYPPGYFCPVAVGAGGNEKVMLVYIISSHV